MILKLTLSFLFAAILAGVFDRLVYAVNPYLTLPFLLVAWVLFYQALGLGRRLSEVHR